MELEAGVREALDHVHALGTQDGVEHLVLVRDGKVAGETVGDRNSVSFHDLHAQPGDIVVHNHPKSLNALSNVDAAQLFYVPIKAMYAISADKSVYKAERGALENIDPWVFIGVSTDAAMFLTGLAKINLVMDADVESIDGKGLGQGHWINRIMAMSGAIKYSYELQPETAARVAEVDKALGFDKLARNIIV